MAKSGDLKKRGVDVGEVKLDLEAMMGEKKKAVGALTGGMAHGAVFFMGEQESYHINQ